MSVVSELYLTRSLCPLALSPRCLLVVWFLETQGEWAWRRRVTSDLQIWSSNHRPGSPPPQLLRSWLWIKNQHTFDTESRSQPTLFGIHISTLNTEIPLGFPNGVVPTTWDSQSIVWVRMRQSIFLQLIGTVTPFRQSLLGVGGCIFVEWAYTKSVCKGTKMETKVTAATGMATGRHNCSNLESLRNSRECESIFCQSRRQLYTRVLDR